NRGGDDRVRGRCGGIEHIQVGDAVAVRRRADFELVITAADRNPEGGIAELAGRVRVSRAIGAEEALLATREVEDGGPRLGAPRLAHVGDVRGNRDGEENRGDRDHHHQLDQREAGRSGRAVSAVGLHGASPGRCGDDYRRSIQLRRRPVLFAGRLRGCAPEAMLPEAVSTWLVSYTRKRVPAPLVVTKDMPDALVWIAIATASVYFGLVLNAGLAAALGGRNT